MGEKGLLRPMRKDWGADEELEGLSDGEGSSPMGSRSGEEGGQEIVQIRYNYPNFQRRFI